MRPYYYRFLIAGYRPKNALIFKGLKLYAPKSSQNHSVIETIRRTSDLNNTKQKVYRLLELLRIFYLNWVTSYRICRNKSNRDENWEFLEIVATPPVSVLEQYAMYDERYIADFLEFTYNKRRYHERIYRSNILLIEARTSGMLFEVRFLLRWLALESLLREEKIITTAITEMKFARLKAAAERFAQQSIPSQEVRNIFIEKIDRTRGDMRIRNAFEKFVLKRNLPVRFKDIKECKNVRDIIVHYGSIEDIGKNLGKYNNLSNRMEALVRNLIMYYLGLKFDPDWKIWYAWSSSKSKPQKR